MLFDYLNNVSFAQPEFLWAFILFPLLFYWYYRNNDRQQARILISTTSAGRLKSWKNIFRHSLFYLRLAAFAFMIMALARPQTHNEEQHAEGEGIDIILCIDVSGSMTAQDFLPNRLEAAKKVAMEFVQKRPTDRMGVVIFSGESFTQCPLTTDQAVLLSAIRNIRNGLLEDGTAIGSGLGTSIERLRASTSPSRVVLLLTDGENNGGLIDPITAKEIAKAYGVKVYTVGVGSEGYAPQPVNTPLGVVIQKEKVTIDEKLLREIATETGGRYYRATDNLTLNNIYVAINNLEKSKIEIVRHTRTEEKFFPFAIAALIFLLLEFILRYTIFRKFP